MKPLACVISLQKTDPEGGNNTHPHIYLSSTQEDTLGSSPRLLDASYLGLALASTRRSGPAAGVSGAAVASRWGMATAAGRTNVATKCGTALVQRAARAQDMVNMQAGTGGSLQGSA